MSLASLTLSWGCASLGPREGKHAGIDWHTAVKLYDLQLEDPLRFDEDMAGLAHRLAGSGTDLERLRRLQGALFDDEKFPFEYQSNATLGAIEAYHAREGNCVSATSLFIALGRALDIEVWPIETRTSSFDVEDRSDVLIVTEHVMAAIRGIGGFVLFDFNSQAPRRDIEVLLLTDREFQTIYLNNLGTDALLEGDLEAATRLLSAALKLDPGRSQTYANLGVVARRRGDPQEALAIYEKGLEAEPDAPAVLNNLAHLYSSLGLHDEARSALLAADSRSATPHLLLARGELAVRNGDLPQGLRMFRRALKRDPDFVPALIAAAQVYERLGREGRAARLRDRAEELKKQR